MTGHIIIDEATKKLPAGAWQLPDSAADRERQARIDQFARYLAYRFAAETDPQPLRARLANSVCLIIQDGRVHGET